VTAALVYGGALVLSGWLVSRGVDAADRALWRERLGMKSASRSSTDRIGIAMVLRDRQRLLSFGQSLVGALLGYRLAGPVGLLAGSFAGVVIARARRSRAALQRRDLLDRQLGEAIDTIAAAVRAGLSVRRAVVEAARDVEPPLRDELESVVRRLETGEPLDAALARLDDILRLSDARLVVTALAVHRRSGGDLPTLLGEIGNVMRARREDRRGIRALTTQVRSSGVVLAVLPVAFVALLSGTGGDGLGAFYRSGDGTMLLLVAFLLQALGFAWMRRIVAGVEAA
jgi:tight adherence protein B